MGRAGRGSSRRLPWAQVHLAKNGEWLSLWHPLLWNRRTPEKDRVQTKWKLARRLFTSLSHLSPSAVISTLDSKCLEIWLDWVAFQLGSYSRVLMPAQAEGVPPAPSWLVSFSSLVSPWNIPLDLKPLVSLLESRRALWLPGCRAGQPKWRLISLPLQNDILGLPMKGERHISSLYLEMNSG